MNSIAPTNWRNSWELTKTTKKLFRFLSQHRLSLAEVNSTMFYAYNIVCKCNKTTVDVQFLSPCYHEETDTRVFLDVNNMARNGCIKLAIRTTDTDVLILAISSFHELKVDLGEIWVDFGAAKKICFFWVHEI